MFCKVDSASIELLQQDFTRFPTALGLQANRDKSSIYTSRVKDIVKQQIL